ncbi:MAG: methylmalonyl Co-A mutase-associated GTPase MeaB [Planctomycetes bacterium]|nr:methylmalonyl Co-A mutase-associated GTPase MeaB [Planctomycetota bacterium]
MTARPSLTIDAYVEGILARDISVVARAVTLVESRRAEDEGEAARLLAALAPHTGGSIRVGITGVPGVGKSTFVDAIGIRLIRDGRRVAVLAVDPSSEISGGSILGDKTRMVRLASDSGAFIRPSPSGGTLGGVARRTRETMLVCEAAGFDVVLVETVGVGQSETMVAKMTDCLVALMLPGAGDELQGIKRGLLELVDIIAVNKADGATRDAAKRAARQYELALQAVPRRDGGEPPVVLTCSARSGDGLDDVWAAVQDRYDARTASGSLTEHRRRQCLTWMWDLVDERLQSEVRADARVRAMRDRIESEVGNGSRSAESAAREILDAFRRTQSKPTHDAPDDGANSRIG